MTEAISTSRALNTKPFYRHSAFVIVLLAFFISTAFKPVRPNPSRAEDAEMMQFRSEIIGYAQNFLGLRYRSAGHSPKTGFDCSGFTNFILDEFGVKVSTSSSTQSRQGIKVPLSDVLPGDLIFFGSRGRIQHVAMVIEKTAEGIFCVHSTCTRGIVVENISTSKYWKPRILFARDVISAQAG
ncbi:MAG: C40 family peptidase [Saprospiraceae bacterium]|nr:C40 family peptidase [Saprospiraceae bacterium]